MRLFGTDRKLILDSGSFAMIDIVDSKRRSEMMAGIKGRDTLPELTVRRTAHRLGLRFRLYRKDLPGCPDLVFPRHRLAVFVHGCFWHRHDGCHYAYLPKSHIGFWREKFAGNVERDGRSENALRELGWRVLVIWECETRDERTIRKQLFKHIEHSESNLYQKNQRLFENDKKREESE